ncbi:MAG: ankyrin repeat domain-containing protein [Epsilonproteobacteria bacterium]|nr:ankyrin repeat domain-containing protein [Campylobacterota bacterium]
MKKTIHCLALVTIFSMTAVSAAEIAMRPFQRWSREVLPKLARYNQERADVIKQGGRVDVEESLLQELKDELQKMIVAEGLLYSQKLHLIKRITRYAAHWNVQKSDLIISDYVVQVISKAPTKTKAIVDAFSMKLAFDVSKVSQSMLKVLSGYSCDADHYQKQGFFWYMCHYFSLPPDSIPESVVPREGSEELTRFARGALKAEGIVKKDDSALKISDFVTTHLHLREEMARLRYLDGELFAGVINGESHKVCCSIRDGADIDVRGTELGVTPLACALMAHKGGQASLEMINLLLNKNADKHIRFFNGQTVMHIVVEHCPYLVDMFLREGLQVDKQDFDGITPIDIARERGLEHVVEKLEQRQKEFAFIPWLS